MQHLFEKYKPHYAYHTATYEHAPIVEDKATEAIETNGLGTEVIVDFFVKYGTKISMLITTHKTANPTNAMPASKRIAAIYERSLKSICDKDHVFTNGLSNNDRHMAMSMKQIGQEFKSKNGSLRN